MNTEQATGKFKRAKDYVKRALAEDARKTVHDLEVIDRNMKREADLHPMVTLMLIGAITLVVITTCVVIQRTAFMYAKFN